MTNKLTPTHFAYEKMQKLLYKTVYKTKPPEKLPLHGFVGGYAPIELTVYKVGKIKSKLAYLPWAHGKMQYFMVNNKDIYTQEDWDAARDRWEKEKLWAALSK